MGRLHPKFDLNVAVYVAVIIAAIAFGVFTFTQKSRNNATIYHIELTEQSSCIATNINRAATNTANYIEYKGLTQTINYSMAQEQAQIASLKQLGLSPKVLRAAIKEANKDLANQEQRRNALFWTRLSDCKHFNRTVTDVAVTTFVEAIPPHSQLSLQNAKQIEPKGT